MIPEKPLYEDSELRICFMPGAPEDHLIRFTTPGKPDAEYVLQRGCLETLAQTSRDMLRAKLDTLNNLMTYDAEDRGIRIESIGLALSQAYTEQEKRYGEFSHPQHD